MTAVRQNAYCNGCRRPFGNTRVGTVRHEYAARRSGSSTSVGKSRRWNSSWR